MATQLSLLIDEHRSPTVTLVVPSLVRYSTSGAALIPDPKRSTR